jgi:hypothetical protein
MNTLVNSLADVCRDRRIEQKLLIAPTIRTGHLWLDSVTMIGAPVLNARVKTFQAFAMDLAEPKMRENGLRFLSEFDGALIVAKTIEELGAKNGGYFTRNPPTFGLYQKIFSSIADMRNAGLDAEDLETNRLQPARKGEELRTLFLGFVEELDRRRLIDYAGALDLARDRFASEDPLGDTLVLAPKEEIELNFKETALLDVIPKERVIRLPEDEPGTTAQGAYSETDAYLLRSFLAPETALGSEKRDGTVRFFRAEGEANEIRHIVRVCLQEAVPFDDVEIVHTDYDTYVPLTHELAEAVRLSWGMKESFVTFEESLPASVSRPGKALALWIGWMRDDYPQSVLLNLIADGLLELPKVGERRISKRDALRALRSLKIGFGVTRWRRILGEAASREAAEDGDASDGRRLSAVDPEVLKALADMINGLLDISAADEGSAAQALDDAATFLKRFARCRDEVDHTASKELERALIAAAVSLDVTDALPAGFVRDWIANLPAAVRIMGSLPQPGKIHVSNIYTGGHTLRTHTFIVGLNEGRFPGGALQDPVILDKERSGLSSRLSRSTERLDAKLRGFARLLARLRGSVTLSYPSLDVSNDREMFPGPGIIGAYQALTGDSEATREKLFDRLGPPVSFFPQSPEGCATLTDLRLCRSEDGYRYGGSGRGFAARFPHLARGEAAATMRSGEDFTEYDGRIPGPQPDLDPRLPNKEKPVPSASMWETLGRCPRKYFFQYVLRLKPPEETDITQWIDAGTFGALLHEILCEFAGDLGERGKWPPDPNRDLPELMNAAKKRIEKWKRLEPSPNEGAIARRERELERALVIFLTEEASAGKHRKPYALEACVGMENKGRTTPLDTIEPAKLRLPDGTEVPAQAKIDRVDEIRDQGGLRRYGIIDYKSGGASNYGFKDPFAGGRVIQHALYLEIVNQALQRTGHISSQATEMSYFFPNSREHGLRISYIRDDLADFPKVLQNLCDIAATGAFLPTDDADGAHADCRYCEFTSICGDVSEISRAAAAKLANPKNESLRFMKELRSRE